MGIKRLQNQSRSKLNAEQKVAFVFLSFLGLGGLIFGFRSFGVSLDKPVRMQIVNYATGEKYLSPDEREQKEREDAKNSDLDNDGITDYDELYVYKTSPYLADSDSDGFDDRTEIFSGNDPNCPEGDSCGPVVVGAEGVVDSKKEDVQNVLHIMPGAKDALNAGAYDLNNQDDVKELFKNLGVDDIRKSLINSGASQEIIDSLDDATINKYFDEAINEITPESESDGSDVVESDDSGE